MDRSMPWFDPTDYFAVTPAVRAAIGGARVFAEHLGT